MTIGLDISTSCVGLSIFDNNNKLYTLTCIKFKKTTESNLFTKLDEFIKFFSQFEKLDITHISIEEPLKRFKGKFSNSHTLQILAAFNAMISSYLYLKTGLVPVYYNVNTARKFAFPNLVLSSAETKNIKADVWRAVVKAEPLITWEYSKRTNKLVDETFDMCDAYVVGMADIVARIKNSNYSGNLV